MKNKTNEQILENGKIVIVNFKKLNYEDFLFFANSQRELEKSLIVFSMDGRCFINANNKDCFSIAEVYKDIIKLTRYEIENQKKLLTGFLGRKTNDNELLRIEGESKPKALYLFFLNVELKRRKIEMQYKKRQKGKMYL